MMSANLPLERVGKSRDTSALQALIRRLREYEPGVLDIVLQHLAAEGNSFEKKSGIPQTWFLHPNHPRKNVEKRINFGFVPYDYDDDEEIHATIRPAWVDGSLFMGDITRLMSKSFFLYGNESEDPDEWVGRLSILFDFEDWDRVKDEYSIDRIAQCLETMVPRYMLGNHKDVTLRQTGVLGYQCELIIRYFPNFVTRTGFATPLKDSSTIEEVELALTNRGLLDGDHHVYKVPTANLKKNFDGIFDKIRLKTCVVLSYVWCKKQLVYDTLAVPEIRHMLIPMQGLADLPDRVLKARGYNQLKLPDLFLNRCAHEGRSGSHMHAHADAVLATAKIDVQAAADYGKASDAARYFTQHGDLSRMAMARAQNNISGLNGRSALKPFDDPLWKMKDMPFLRDYSSSDWDSTDAYMHAINQAMHREGGWSSGTDGSVDLSNTPRRLTGHCMKNVLRLRLGECKMVKLPKSEAGRDVSGPYETRIGRLTKRQRDLCDREDNVRWLQNRTYFRHRACISVVDHVLNETTSEITYADLQQLSAAAREGVDYSVRLASKRDEFLQAKDERTMLALIKAIVRSTNDAVGPQNVRVPAEKTGTKDKEKKQRTDGKTAHRNRARDQEISRRRSQPGGKPAPRTDHHM